MISRLVSQPDEVNYPIPGMETALDKLVVRAEKLFVWNSGTKDEHLIHQIKDNLTGEDVRAGIKHHQMSLEQMPSMAEGSQIRFLMHQIEIDRFLADWDDYTAAQRAQARASLG